LAEDQTQGALGRRLVANMERMTRDRTAAQCLENARRNVEFRDRGQSLADLRNASLGEGDSAIIIAAGPSIRRNNPIAAIKSSGYKGALVVTESAISYCLNNDVVPDLIVTVDPNPDRIVRWFGDPNLTHEALKHDDYYRRQDMDESFANEIRNNERILELVNRFGPKMKIALSTSASESVVKRVLDTGMEIFWWNPMLDDPDQTDGMTRELHGLNPLPCVNAGGNVGSACWMMADAVLGKRHVALTGIDLGYYDDTPYAASQYYPEAVALVGEENLDQVFIRIFNPHIQTWFYTDPAYMWYREALLEMTSDGECQTYNCTGGGILFGDHIEFVALEEFIEKMSERRNPHG
jgi:hypothetical protein